MCTVKKKSFILPGCKHVPAVNLDYLNMRVCGYWLTKGVELHVLTHGPNQTTISLQFSSAPLWECHASRVASLHSAKWGRGNARKMAVTVTGRKIEEQRRAGGLKPGRRDVMKREKKLGEAGTLSNIYLHSSLFVSLKQAETEKYF